MEPYVYRDGRVAGASEPEPPARRCKPGNRLALRARRAKIDPNWATHSEATKDRLVELDAKERGL